MATNSKNKKTVTKAQQAKQNEIVELTAFAEQQLIEKKKAELPKFIRKRKKEFIKELQEYKIANSTEADTMVIADKVIPMLELVDNCFSPFIKDAGIAPQYSAKELSVIFDYYKECVKEMNKYEIVPPTKELYCSLCGFSTETFTKYKNGSSPEIREVCLRVEDFIANYLTISGLTRKTSEVTGIFVQKSSLGRKEDTGPQQVTNNNTLILSDTEFAELLSKYSTNK